MIGLILHEYLGIGDKIQFTHIPENIFKSTGKKIFDISNSWVFDNNPYVERNILSETVDLTIDLWLFSQQMPRDGFKSHADRFFQCFNKLYNFNIEPMLRHPRLYLYENEEIRPDRVIVHTTGKSEIMPLNEKVIQAIQNNYKNYEIIQIGGYEDKPTPFKKMLGLNFFDTAKLIATSSIFIGVNSGMMNIANCYPRVNKKILIPRNLDIFCPMSNDNVWFDHGTTFFNYTEQDYGATFSYLKI